MSIQTIRVVFLGTSFPPVGSFLSTTATLTDAQIKNLPVTPVIIVPNPGVGKWISIIQIILTSHFEGGAYSGWLNGDSILTETSSSIHDLASESIADLTHFLGNTFGTSNLLILRPWIASCSTHGYGVNEEPGAAGFYLDRPLTLFSQSTQLPWTGGHPSNTLRVKTIYTIEDA